jgi:thymidylate synthase ThyX
MSRKQEIKVEGNGNISAEVVADSISPEGKRITTYVLEYPRFIHSEFMTHRLFSRNAASSRAIPVTKVIEHMHYNSAEPIHWGKNQAGMQAKEELEQPYKIRVQQAWAESKFNAIDTASKMSDEGAHKQIVNRILEPFQMIRVVCTATEYDNFFYLRYHADAQPEIAELARVMWEAMQQSKPELLYPGEWHTPFVNHERDKDGNLHYFVEEISRDDDQSWGMKYEKYLTLEEALKISSSCSAQVSYRKADTSLEKALSIYDKLITMKPCHASPLEHQATPMDMHTWEFESYESGADWDEGATHCDKNGKLWSGNFKQWVQYRQLIPDNVCNNFVKENEQNGN